MPFITQGPEGEQSPYGVNKTNWKFLLIVVVLAAIVGGGVWWYQKTLEQSNPLPLPLPEIRQPEKTTKDESADFTPSEIEGWQTYRNEEYGFEFKYPSSYFAREFFNFEGLLHFIEIADPKHVAGYRVLIYVYLIGEGSQDQVRDTSEMSFKEFAETIAMEQCTIPGTMGRVDCDKVVEAKPFTVSDKIKGYEIYLNEISIGVERDEKGEIIEERSSNRKKGPVFVLDVSEQTNNQIRGMVFGFNVHIYETTKKEEKEKEGTEEAGKIINQMLSTFRFIEPAENTESAGTCRNNCGNGICEEVVCLAIGCPCAETKENCPQDCGKEIPQIEIKNFTTDKKTYTSNEELKASLTVLSSGEIKGVVIKLTGIKPHSYNYINDSQTINLNSGENKIIFTEKTPNCTSGCGGVYPGPYDLNAEIFINENLVASSTISINLTNE